MDRPLHPIVRALGWVFLCTLLALPLRAPFAERVCDPVVLVDRASAERAPEAIPIRAVQRAPSWPSGGHAEDQGGPPSELRGVPGLRLYLRHRALLL